MQKLRSEIADISHKNRAEDFRKEFVDYSSSFDGTMGMEKHEDYIEWLEFLELHKCFETLPEGHVITTVFFVISVEDDRIIGIYSIKHYLNELFIRVGNGNIGYCVRPTERKKGYATQMLKMALAKCSEMDMKTVHISCHERNIASKKVILKNGGVLYKEHQRNDGIRLEYTINL